MTITDKNNDTYTFESFTEFLGFYYSYTWNSLEFMFERDDLSKMFQAVDQEKLIDENS